MHLFDLPLELLDQIFSDAVEDRTFKRVMRLRLVNRPSHTSHIDDILSTNTSHRQFQMLD